MSSSRPGLNMLVLSTAAEHPDWTARQIADHLATSAAYIRATLRRNGRSSPNKHSPSLKRLARNMADAIESGDLALMNEAARQYRTAT